MKNSFNLLILFLLLAFVSCASLNQKRKCKTQPFQELDSLQRAEKVLNYTIDLPDDWEKSKYSSGDWYYIKGEFVDSLNYNRRLADVYISSDKIDNECKLEYTLEDYLDLFLSRKKRMWGKGFSYQLVESKHKKYERMYLLKFKEKFPHAIYESVVFIIYYKQNGYTVEYKNEEKNFKNYIKDIDKIINSFSIVE